MVKVKEGRISSGSMQSCLKPTKIRFPLFSYPTQYDLNHREKGDGGGTEKETKRRNKRRVASRLLLLGSLGGDLLNGQSWGKRLLELGGLLSVLEDEGVEVSRASDLELGDRLGGGALGRLEGSDRSLHQGLLDQGGCERRNKGRAGQRRDRIVSDVSSMRELSDRSSA